MATATNTQVCGAGERSFVMRRALLTGVAVCAAACSRAKPAPLATSAPVSIETTVRPVRAGAEEVAYVQVRTELRGTIDQTTRPLSFRAPIVYASVPEIANRVDSLTLRDASGAIPLTIENDPVNRGGFPFYRHWRAGRAVVPPVVLSYRTRGGVPKLGPQFDLFTHGGGISSGGMALFVTPEGIATADMRVSWDLKDLAKGSTAASTNGDGNFRIVGSPEQLVQAYYMVGPLGVYKSKSIPFSAYWLGKPAFEPLREMAWTERAYQAQRRFFKDTTAREYRVFVRAAAGAGGGTALRNSFMLGTAPGNADSTRPGPRETLAHEMGHMFVGSVAAGGTGGATWFNEGLNVHYTRLVLLRSGLEPIESYLGSVNSTARGYYTNSFRNASADSLERVGFSAGVAGGSAQNVPYTRGSLFFADADAKIRAATNGRRTLDDVMLPLFERRRGGETLTVDKLLGALAVDLGPSVRERFDAVLIRGETIVPDPNAFGTCFERRATTFTNQGQQMDGYEWVRKPGMSDQQCREW